MTLVLTSLEETVTSWPSQFPDQLTLDQLTQAVDNQLTQAVDNQLTQAADPTS